MYQHQLAEGYTSRSQGWALDAPFYEVKTVFLLGNPTCPRRLGWRDGHIAAAEQHFSNPQTLYYLLAA